MLKVVFRIFDYNAIDNGKRNNKSNSINITLNKNKSKAIIFADNFLNFIFYIKIFFLSIMQLAKKAILNCKVSFFEIN